GTPLGDLMEVRNAILSERPQSVLALLDGQYIGFHDEATVWNFLLYDVPTVRFLDDSLDVYPAEKSLYLSKRCDGAERVFRLRSSDQCFGVSARSIGDFE